MTMFGAHTALENCTIKELRDTWTLAESLDFDWVSIWDHLLPAASTPDAQTWDSVACHAALALTTSRVRVGSLVYSNGFRNPALLAKSAATIDHLSGGRMELGLGAGWNRAEYVAFGVPFEAPPVRLRRLAEAIELIRRVWTEPVVDHAGEFYRVEGARCGGAPLQSSPRIWVGATGERLGLKMAAAVNDGWNCTAVTPEEFARKRQILLEAAAAPERMVCAVNVGFGDAAGEGPALTGTSEEMVDRVGQYVEAGADMIVLRMVAPFNRDEIAQFATEVIPKFR